MAFRRVFAAGLAVLVAGCASERDAPRPAVEASWGTPSAFANVDDRVLVDTTRAPWRSIGKIYTSDGGECTAVLVGVRVILTAAHCMFDGPGSTRRVQIDRFTVGEAGQGAADAALVVNSVVPPQFDNTAAPGHPGKAGWDYAFAVLDRPLGRDFGYLPVRAMDHAALATMQREARPALSQAGYSADLTHVLTAHIGCRILWIYGDNTMDTDCDALPGDSGSPVLIEEDGEVAIIGLVSAIFVSGGRLRLSKAVDSRAFYTAYADVVARYP